MGTYAILDAAGNIEELREFDVLPAHKPGRVLPVVDGEKPTPLATETLVVESLVVQSDSVLRTWAVEPLPVPSLDACQLRLWLIAAGIPLSAVDAQIGAIADPMAREGARIEWEYETVYKRDHPLVEQIGAALGMTSEQLDNAFFMAANL